MKKLFLMFLRRYAVLYIFFIFPILSGCTVQYALMGSKSFEGGYDDKKLGDGHYAIKIRGNGYSTPELMHDYFHRRAKELSREKAYVFKTESTTTSGSNLYSTGMMTGITFHTFPIFYGEIIVADEANSNDLSDSILYLEEWALQKRNN